jgi:hypothetical protein
MLYWQNIWPGKYLADTVPKRRRNSTYLRNIDGQIFCPSPVYMSLRLLKTFLIHRVFESPSPAGNIYFLRFASTTERRLSTTERRTPGHWKLELHY